MSASPIGSARVFHWSKRVSHLRPHNYQPPASSTTPWITTTPDDATHPGMSSWYDAVAHTHLHTLAYPRTWLLAHAHAHAHTTRTHNAIRPAHECASVASRPHKHMHARPQCAWVTHPPTHFTHPRACPRGPALAWPCPSPAATPQPHLPTQARAPKAPQRHGVARVPHCLRHASPI